jgi:DNA-binding response OmpR family regulator
MPRSHTRLSISYAYDASTSTLLCDNVTHHLSKRQLQIIDLLARNRGRVVDFEQFRTYIWDDEYVDNATIRAEVSRLKKSLKEDFIQNIRALGYMIDIPRSV